jgi:hypothetical protein
MLLDRFDHVLRTRRRKTTLTPQQRTYRSLVKLDHSNQYPSQSFLHRFQPCSPQKINPANAGPDLSHKPLRHQHKDILKRWIFVRK